MPSKIKGELSPFFLFCENAKHLFLVLPESPVRELKQENIVFGVKNIFLPFHMVKL